MPERLGSLSVIVGGLLAVLVHVVSPAGAVPTTLLVLDGVLAAAFLFLAVCYGRAWLGVAMLLQGVQFSLHAYYFVGDLGHDMTYSLVNNLVTIGILAAIVIGTIDAMRRRAA
ncbi:hypothetical protein P7B02_19390 [Caulobacter segnis]|uniref:hypothetical protein n=1 Tax=Caulobacter segnis TaxID=88688 RepID=UPI00240FE811|nr:hypothetical protein [Caulobacter segnis]MDG2523698.1 hypothetical protein [Caulobacter segnis]